MLAGYRVERLLGVGGMGSVYLARNPELPRLDALKVLSGVLSQQAEFRARFIREADLASSLSHPNIVSVYSRGESDDGSLWIAMQYVDGTDADDALKAGGMTPARAAHVVNEVAKALDYAHLHQVVHRDVKPGNFLLSGAPGDDERVLLGDFGIARALDDVGLTMTGSVVATMAYAAPEVLSGHQFDGRADVYSLTCSLFRLLTGKTPFSAANGPAAVMMAHLHRPPPRVTELAPRLPAALDAVIATGMAKDPARRYRTAGELAAAAVAALRDNVAEATAAWSAVPSSDVSPYPRPDGGQRRWHLEPAERTQMRPLPTSPAPPRRRLRVIVAATAVALVAVATTAAVLLHGAPDERAAPQRTSTPAPTSTVAAPAPIIAPTAVAGLLPAPGELAPVLGAPGLEVGQTARTPFDNSSELKDPQCIGPWGAGQRPAYRGSGFQGFRVDTYDVAGDPDHVVNASVAVATFPSAGRAEQFLSAQQGVWNACANHMLTFDYGAKGTRITQLGAATTTPRGLLVLPLNWPDLPQQLCQHALAAQNNAVVDVQACTRRPPEPLNREDPAVVAQLNPAATIVDLVLTKIDEG